MFTMTAEAKALRSAQARAAALRGAALRDNVAQGRIGQRGLAAKFYAQVDARFSDIAPEEREKRMRMLLSAHMTLVRSARTRRAFRRASTTPQDALTAV